ncbi:K(+)-transporting ATPase subunit C [bacterium BFN5]|nr:K(+)-transporting ATPase subunit C [bacterium BFN5]
MWKQVSNSIRMLVLLTIVLGLVYPLGMVGIAQALFPEQAGGSLIMNQGTTVGSRLIGQTFTGPAYFYSRPSAAGEGYDGANSGGSNLGPTNQKLMATVAERVETARQDNDAAQSVKVPADLVLASASGLDPHITPTAAYFQADRVAQARGLTSQQVRQLVDSHIEKKQLGFLGEERVNVLLLNVALDNLY